MRIFNVIYTYDCLEVFKKKQINILYAYKQSYQSLLIILITTFYRCLHMLPAT